MDFEMQPPNINDTSATLLQDLADPKTQAHVPEPPPIWRSRRILVAAVIFFNFTSMVCMTQNLNFALEHTISSKTTHHKDGTVTIDNSQLNWIAAVSVLSRDYPIVGPLLAVLAIGKIKRLGGSISYAICGTMSGIVNFLHPVFLLYLDTIWLKILRSILAFFNVLGYASIAEIVSRWFPQREKCTLISYSYNGVIFGSSILPPLCACLVRWRWQMIFYITGLMGIASSIVCILFVKNLPSQDERISQPELSYIQQGTYNTPSQKWIPLYKNLQRCRPFWALCVCQFLYTWIDCSVVGYSRMYGWGNSRGSGNDDDSFIKTVLHIAQIFVFPCIGMLMDFEKNNNKIAITRMHKIIISVTYLCTASLLAVVTYASRMIPISFAFIVIRFYFPIIALIVQIITVSIVPNNSNVIAGLSTIVIYFSDFILYYATSYSQLILYIIEEGNMRFLSKSIASILAAVTFLQFGSSDPQPWSLSLDSQTS